MPKFSSFKNVNHLKQEHTRQSPTAIIEIVSRIFEFDQVTFFIYPYMKLHILFNRNVLAIWSGFPDISHTKKIMTNN